MKPRTARPAPASNSCCPRPVHLQHGNRRRGQQPIDVVGRDEQSVSGNTNHYRHSRFDFCTMLRFSLDRQSASSARTA